MSSSELEDNSIAEADEVSDEEEIIVEAKVTKKRATKGKKKKDPNAPKRPQSAFFLFSNATRSVVKEESPSASFGDVVSVLCWENHNHDHVRGRHRFQVSKANFVQDSHCKWFEGHLLRACNDFTRLSLLLTFACSRRLLHNNRPSF